jgi:hypothetical protein
MGHALRILPVVLRRHIRDAGAVNPAVVEVEQRANTYRVVDRFFGPTGSQQGIDIRLADIGIVTVQFVDETKE